MAYCTLADMVAEYDRPEMPELTQLVPDASDPPALDTTAVEEAVEEASGLMDEYIGARYALPLAGLSAKRAAWLRRVNMEIARFLLWRDRASDEVRKRYEDHLRYLRDLAHGTVNWLDAGMPDTSSAGAPLVSAPAPVFDSSTLADY